VDEGVHDLGIHALWIPLAEPLVVFLHSDQVVTALVEEVVELFLRKCPTAQCDHLTFGFIHTIGLLCEGDLEAVGGAPVNDGIQLFDVEHVPVPLCLRSSRGFLLRLFANEALEAIPGPLPPQFLVEPCHLTSSALRPLSLRRGGIGVGRRIGLRGAEDLEDVVDAPLVDRLRQLEVVHPTGRQLRPGRHPELRRECTHEVPEVGTLVVVQGLQVLRDVVGHLLDGDVELLLAELGDLRLDLGVVLDDLLAGDLGVDRLDEAVEGDRCLRADEAEAHRVEERIVREICHAGTDQGLGQPLPAAAGGRDLRGLHVLGRIEPLLVACDEGDDVLVDGTGLLGPGEPVLRVRREVDGPEAIEECRIHLVDRVGRRGVDGSVDARLRVELPAVELTVEDDLEGGLHHLGGGAVELVEEQGDRLRAGLAVPVRRVEPRDLAVRGRETDHVAFRHLREAAVDHLEAEALGHLADDLALADAVVATEEDRGLDGELGGDVEERADGHRGHFVVSLVEGIVRSYQVLTSFALKVLVRP
jgi:hypothetical protein